MRSTNSDRSIYLKRCPRCRGDIHASRDQYGKYIHCLQCGYAADIPRPNPFRICSPTYAATKWHSRLWLR